MKQNNILCSITTTLYPSYAEQLTSPASNELIEAHIRECPRCQKLFSKSGCQNILPDIPAVDAAANLSEASYLRRYRRLFFAATLGVFFGILLFALLMVNISFGINQFWKKAVRQHSVRVESPAKYHQWDNYRGISDFFIFPENLSACKTVNDYLYQCDSSSFSCALQIYLDCTYTPKDYEAEKQRLLKTSQADLEQSLFARPACYTMLFYDTACEYAIFLEEEHRIVYVSLENISRDEIAFDETYLPLDYGIFGSPPENQAKPFCIYKK